MLGTIVLARKDRPVALFYALCVELSRAQVVVFVVIDRQLIDGGQARIERDERRGDRGDDEEQSFDRGFLGHGRSARMPRILTGNALCTFTKVLRNNRYSTVMPECCHRASNVPIGEACWL